MEIDLPVFVWRRSGHSRFSLGHSISRREKTLDIVVRVGGRRLQRDFARHILLDG